MVSYELDINLAQGGVPPQVNLSQYDNTLPVITATIWNGDVQYSIPSGATVFLVGTKKDNTGFQYECTYSGAVVTATITEQMTAFAGKVPCEFVIQIGSERKGTQNFKLAVEPAALEDDTVISETDIPIIQELSEYMSTLDTAMTQTETWRDEAEDFADNAEDAYENILEAVQVSQFTVDFTTGELMYTASPYTFNINTTTGNLEWEVA